MPPEHWYPARDPVARARFVTLASGERVRIVEAGDAGSDLVVLLHGWGGSAYNFRHVLPRLARSGRRAVAADLRGHGLSEKPGAIDAYSSGAMAQHTLMLLDALGTSRATLVGQSMAGAVVLDVTHRAPQRVQGAVLLAPIGFTPIRRVSLARLFRARAWGPDRVPRWMVTFVLRRVYGARGGWSARDVEELWAALRFPEVVTALFALVERFDWSPRQPDPAGLAVPLRILFGERDRLIPASRAQAHARSFTGAEVSVVPGAGHLLADEVPDEVADAIVGLHRRAPA
jgi:pyruvate dehydrogenase E2 component (dihydrolipoamide acetyltransferase)